MLRAEARGRSSEDEAEQDPGLTVGVTGLWKAFLLLEVPHGRGCVVGWPEWAADRWPSLADG
jgi:hypothetical protein